jgi:methionyl-tRNA formyltransferase
MDVKLYGARLLSGLGAGQPGEILSVDGDGLVVACGEGAVRVLQVQPAGKKRMAPQEWVRGRGVSIGQRFA